MTNMFDQMRKDNSFRATPENIAKLGEQFGVKDAKSAAEIVRRGIENKEIRTKTGPGAVVQTPDHPTQSNDDGVSLGMRKEERRRW